MEGYYHYTFFYFSFLIDTYVIEDISLVHQNNYRVLANNNLFIIMVWSKSVKMVLNKNYSIYALECVLIQIILSTGTILPLTFHTCRTMH